ncbi:MAG: hypothetical protein K2O69_02725 [Odoribacter sp.]|nr:hypothetical protein [Odoribacter sp.]
MAIRCVADMKCDTILTDTSVTICTNDLPYEYCDTTFDIGTESGIYRFHRISAVTGYDSIANLHLTVYPSYDTIFMIPFAKGMDITGMD